MHHPVGRFITVNGVDLWVEEEGAGADAPLVLLAGGPANSHVSFHPVFSQLSADVRVIYYDYRGRGRSGHAGMPHPATAAATTASDAPHGAPARAAASDGATARETSARDRPWADVTFAQDVDDLEGLRRALGCDHLNLYGFSYGGLVAQAYALAHPTRVRRLVLANTLHSAEMWALNHANINRELERQYPEIWDEIVALRARGLTSSAPEMRRLFAVHGPIIRWYNPDHASRLLSEPGSRNDDLYVRFVGDDIDFANGGEVARLPDFRPRLRELAMPVLILAGRFDRALYPRLQRDFAAACPQARFVMLEKSGTWGHLEEPDTVMPLLREFLADAS